MNFAKWVFRFAGILGILIVAPFYFSEAQVGRDLPPAITHPEYYYGFIGVTLAWQIGFLIIGSDPLRYRPLMIAAILEKASYAIAIIWLFVLGRVPLLIAGAGLLDLSLGLLFVAAYRATSSRPSTADGKASRTV
ncbi:MAG: hypothetical protein KF832_09350 [Caldilineaceae bacterium]|nr:hypothetical protein [Caldilineaceae bacterium]